MGIRLALERVDATMHTKITHVVATIHLKLMGRERHNDIVRRAHADTEIVTALRALEQAEKNGRAALDTHSTARHAFAVATADVAWIQEHLNEEGSDVDAIATVEAARVSLSNTKTELTNGLTILDAERERFKAVVETSASTEITAAFRQSRDPQVDEMVKGEEEKSNNAEVQATSDSSACQLLQYECRTHAAQSSKAEALLRQSTMFYNTAQRTEENAKDDYDQALEDVDYIHCSPEVKAAIGLAEEAWHAAQENTVRAETALHERELTAREANRLRALTCSKAEVSKIKNIDDQAEAEEEREMVEGTKALENVDVAEIILPKETLGVTGSTGATGGSNAFGNTGATGATGAVVVSFESSTGATGTGPSSSADAAAEEGVAERAEREAAEINAMVDEMQNSVDVQSTADAERKTSTEGKTREEEETERKKIASIVEGSQTRRSEITKEG